MRGGNLRGKIRESLPLRTANDKLLLTFVYVTTPEAQCGIASRLKGHILKLGSSAETYRR